MRLRIEMHAESLKLPINYQPILQGVIYSFFDQDSFGDFIHNQGFRADKRVFKLFSFSNLYGKYTVEDHSIIFEDHFYFYIASASEEFIRLIYVFLQRNHRLLIRDTIVNVTKMKLMELPYFKGKQALSISSLSPVVAYRTENNYVNYFKPSDSAFEDICIGNLREKQKALKNDAEELFFHVEKVNYEKKRLLKFKNTFYISYLFEMDITANYPALKLIYDTGLSSKGPAGFGMVSIDREKDILPI